MEPGRNAGIESWPFTNWAAWHPLYIEGLGISVPFWWQRPLSQNNIDQQPHKRPFVVRSFACCSKRRHLLGSGRNAAMSLPHDSGENHFLRMTILLGTSDDGRNLSLTLRRNGKGAKEALSRMVVQWLVLGLLSQSVGTWIFIHFPFVGVAEKERNCPRHESTSHFPTVRRRRCRRRSKSSSSESICPTHSNSLSHWSEWQNFYIHTKQQSVAGCAISIQLMYCTARDENKKRSPSDIVFMYISSWPGHSPPPSTRICLQPTPTTAQRLCSVVNRPIKGRWPRRQRHDKERRQIW